jgi:hypothetical protein
MPDNAGILMSTAVRNSNINSWAVCHRFEVLTSVTRNNTVFRDVLTCYLVQNYWRFGRNMLPQHGVLIMNISSGSILVAARSKTWVCGFISPRRHGCLSLVRVLCCKAEVSDTVWSPIQRNPTECGVSECDRVASIMRRSWPTRGCWRMEETERAYDISVTLPFLYTYNIEGDSDFNLFVKY